ncbi:hypothetical protein FRX31_006772 [Thalictrum thalictroides]|uniref:Uncharacterized protein n=1 Tax=Thalictrum thalictroides TaxID=46969 RepID=A0A7J6X1Q2_THATH|nr:hypothetical protein FRX31_006772 [Thalictrum thalictroides]
MRAIKQYTSRVHVVDICQALKASIGTSFPGRIYNIVDDDPASRAEVFAFAGEDEAFHLDREKMVGEDEAFHLYVRICRSAKDSAGRETCLKCSFKR